MEQDPHRDKNRDRAFQQFYNSNYAKISLYIARRLPIELHDDAVADTFVAAWKKFDSVPEPSIQWLYQIARFEISHAKRRSAVQRRFIVDEFVDGAMSSSKIDQWIDVTAALDKIPESDAEILRLVLWDGESRDTVASLLGCSVNAATVRYHRALMRLRNVLNVEPLRRSYKAEFLNDPVDENMKSLRDR